MFIVSINICVKVYYYCQYYYGLYVSFVLVFFFINDHVILVKCLCYYFLFASLLCKYLYCDFIFMFICYLLTRSVYWIYRKQQKESFNTNSIVVLFFISVWINRYCFLCFYSCIYWTLCFEYVYYVLIFKIIIWLDFIISRSPEKRFRENFGSILDFLGIPN